MPEPRSLTLAEFRDYLRTVNSRDGRPYEDATINAYVYPAKALDAWMTAQGVDGDFTNVHTALLNRYFREYFQAHGQGGTEVTRQAADLVLADDNLRTVVAAAEEGRRVYGNIRRFLLYALSGGSAEITVMLAGPVLGLALPLLPAQLLWVNLLTHGLAGVALGGEPADPGIMNRPPGRPRKAFSARACGSGSSGSVSWSPRSPSASPCGVMPPGGPGKAWPFSRSVPPSSPSRSDPGPGPAAWPTQCCPSPSPSPWPCSSPGCTCRSSKSCCTPSR